MRRHYSDSYLEKINWKEIQQFYDNGNFWKDIISEFNISSSALSEGIKLGFLKMRTISDSLKISFEKNPRKHSQKTKDKISISRKEYLKNNPDKVPYLLNHSRKESYPEKYFTEIFKKEEINVIKGYRIGLYELDFSIPEKKIDIEIDGSQHYVDKKIIESDKKRNLFLEENGWDIIRINWSQYNKLSHVNKCEFINNFKKYIFNIIDTKPTIKILETSIIHKCKCGNTKGKYSSTCINCRYIKDRKVERPPIDVLLNDIKEIGYSATGRKYGVSDNSIRKWVKV
jgi:very-short-patch-repair endonuclease